MSKLLALTALLSIAGATYGQNGGLEMKAFYSAVVPALVAVPDEIEARPPDKSLRLAYFFIYLTNRGTEPIRIATQVPEPAARFDETKGDRLFILRARIPDNPLDMKLRVAASDLGVVELAQNQSAMLRFREAVSEETLNHVRIAYQVDEELADQHRLWFGKIEVKAENLYPKNATKPNQALPTTMTVTPPAG